MTLGGKVVIGGGTLHVVPRTTGLFALPAADVQPVQTILDAALPLIPKHCGSATDSRTVSVTYNAANAGSTYIGRDSSGATIINLGVLPSSGQDVTHQLVHELGNATGIGLYDLLSGSTRTTTDIVVNDPRAEACIEPVLNEMAGKTVETPLTPMLDAMTRFDVYTQAGIRENPFLMPYADSWQQWGQAIFELLVGPKGFATLGAYNEALFAAVNANNGLLSSTQFQAFLNQGAAIDGMGAGDWCAKYHSVFISMPPAAAAQTGTKFIYWPLFSNDPYSFIGQAWTVSADPSGNLSTATIASGEVDISVTDLSGTTAKSFKTDLSATTDANNPFVMNLTGTVLPGAYTLSATAQGVTIQMPIIVPKSAVLRLADTVYAVLMDANGNAKGGTLTVSGGTLLDSGNGYAIVKADATGTVVMNGQTFTVPATGSRVGFVK